MPATPDNGGMKVLDLQCQHQHVFEGWFASEQDFLAQLERSLVQCPVCGDAVISKRLSAPRLNLAGARDEAPAAQEMVSTDAFEQTLQAAWLAAARSIVAHTDDVGERFAEEARRIHYGECKQRGIRGQTTRAEAEELIEEGVAVMPFVLPQSLKKPLQ